MGLQLRSPEPPLAVFEPLSCSSDANMYLYTTDDDDGVDDDCGGGDTDDDDDK